MAPKSNKKGSPTTTTASAAASAAAKAVAAAAPSSQHKRGSETTSNSAPTPPNGNHDETTDLPPTTTDDEQPQGANGAPSQPGGSHNNKRMVTTEAEGILPDGSRFHMPATISVMRSLIIPRCYSLISTQIWILLCVLTNPLSLYFYYTYGPTDHVMAFYTCQFVFWRLAYNVGIGLILHCQSNGKRFEGWVIRNVLKTRVGRAILERCVAFRDGSVKPFKVADYPQPFSAWMLFRFIVNVILACDLLSYFVLVFVHWAPPEFVTASGALNPVDIGLYVVGVGLIVFAIWSKSDAHRVIGDYAWYWGDFFFLLDQELTFDGIFEMFPHPMYTVGYAFMYGFSLMAKSHTVFYWSVFGHICQMVFLTAVENPHIDKTYNTAYMPTDEEKRREAILYDDERGYFEKKELVVLKNFRFFRATDLVVLLCLAYSVLAWLLASGWFSGYSFLAATNLVGPVATDPWPLRVLYIITQELSRPGSWFAVGQYAFWRVLLLGGLGWALRQQSTHHRWTKEFGNARRAFDSWKVLYNTAVTTTNFCFLLCAVQLGEWGTLFTTNAEEWRLTMAVIGLLLVGINIWVSLGVYEAVGDYGYFYGDFFIDDVPRHLAYSGVYRYLNNPDTVLGCAWFYGVALLAGSPAVTALAIVSHSCVKLFEHFVEAPHMQRKYGSMMRKEGGVRRALKERTKSVRSALDERRRRARVDYERAVARLKQEVERRREAYESLSSRLLSSPTRDRPSGTPSGGVRRRNSPPQHQFPEFPPTEQQQASTDATAAETAEALPPTGRRASAKGGNNSAKASPSSNVGKKGKQQHQE